MVHAACVKENFKLIAQYAASSTFALRVTEKRGEKILKVNSCIRKWFYTAFYNEDSWNQKIKNVLEENCQFLQRQNGRFNDLLCIAQQYNQAVFLKPGFPQVECQNFPQLKPLSVDVVRKERVNDDGPFMRNGKFYYSEEDFAVNHSSEALRIFISTQKERFLSLIGRILFFLFRVDIPFFSRFHYFHNNLVYQNDQPVSDEQRASSYWLGHASCLLHVPLHRLSVNIITDPVEGDLNRLFYPRMTKVARSIENCPAIHVVLLSHNHFDHYSAATLKKLLAQQPVLVVPQGDGQKVAALGFQKVVEMSWWDKISLNVNQDDVSEELQITATPSHHWSGQGIFDKNSALFTGFVIHALQGDIYFAGDSARLHDRHIAMLQHNFNIKTIFQPGGPDENRRDMQSTHQSSADGLWMFFSLLISHIGAEQNSSKEEFMLRVRELKMIYMHMKTYKLGNLHFDDTDQSIYRIITALRQGNIEELKEYELKVYNELLNIGQRIKFQEEGLTPLDISNIVESCVVIPRIGMRTDLSSS